MAPEAPPEVPPAPAASLEPRQEVPTLPEAPASQDGPPTAPDGTLDTTRMQKRALETLNAGGLTLSSDIENLAINTPKIEDMSQLNLKLGDSKAETKEDKKEYSAMELLAKAIEGIFKGIEQLLENKNAKKLKDEILNGISDKLEGKDGKKGADNQRVNPEKNDDFSDMIDPSQKNSLKRSVVNANEVALDAVGADVQIRAPIEGNLSVNSADNSVTIKSATETVTIKGLSDENMTKATALAGESGKAITQGRNLFVLKDKDQPIRMSGTTKEGNNVDTPTKGTTLLAKIPGIELKTPTSLINGVENLELKAVTKKGGTEAIPGTYELIATGAATIVMPNDGTVAVEGKTLIIKSLTKDGEESVIKITGAKLEGKPGEVTSGKEIVKLATKQKITISETVAGKPEARSDITNIQTADQKKAAATAAASK